MLRPHHKSGSENIRTYGAVVVIDSATETTGESIHHGDTRKLPHAGSNCVSLVANAQRPSPRGDTSRVSRRKNPKASALGNGSCANVGKKCDPSGRPKKDQQPSVTQPPVSQKRLATRQPEKGP